MPKRRKRKKNLSSGAKVAIGVAVAVVVVPAVLIAGTMIYAVKKVSEGFDEFGRPLPPMS
jgi:hypothetical protein